jgi:hypothetical protein
MPLFSSFTAFLKLTSVGPRESISSKVWVMFLGHWRSEKIEKG